jgi:hypothetical protein
MRIVVVVALLLVAACSDISSPLPSPGGDQTPDPTAGELGGRVLSKEFGVMPGIAVQVSPDGKATVTDDRGDFEVSRVVPGEVSVSIGSLPAGCTMPEPQLVRLLPGASVRIRFLVDCSGLAT